MGADANAKNTHNSLDNAFILWFDYHLCVHKNFILLCEIHRKESNSQGARHTPPPSSKSADGIRTVVHISSYAMCLGNVPTSCPHLIVSSIGHPPVTTNGHSGILIHGSTARI